MKNPISPLAYLASLSLLMIPGALSAEENASTPKRQISGIYPHLAMYNEEDECGTGAVVPWADRLWIITYAPHRPNGSTDKLYEITPDLEQVVRPESVGGTPANRMIHRESQQLFIGPYVIDADRQVRVIPPSKMYGRLTGNARHLFDPAGKIYCATMEEGIYEIDVKTLAVTELFADEQLKTGRHAKIAGYHGKGFYSGQDRVVYSNNGERGEQARRFPDTPSGALVEWDGKADSWDMIRRNQFTEVTGPGGIYGNESPDTDPIWSVGWDHRSLLLAVLHEGKWTMYRLPKGSHSYDGAHGWNTEWPRIREIGEDSLLMTMHGTFWKFPKTFTPKSSQGIAPRSNYLKVVGDFTTWKDKVILGCDDAARSEFLNKRNLKGHINGTGQSHSNLWFIDREQLDQLGPVIGRGSVWINDDVVAEQPSEPYLFSGYDLRSLHLSHKGKQNLVFTLQVDRNGDGKWTNLRDITVGPGGLHWTEFPTQEEGTWIRLVPKTNGESVTATFQYRNRDTRSNDPAPLFAGLATLDTTDLSGGLLHARGANYRTLRFVARNQNGELEGYDLNGDLTLKPNDDAVGTKWVVENCAPPQNVITVDAASVLYVDGEGNRWRLPKGDSAFDTAGPIGFSRVCREVCTERDLANIHGTFYELPAENAGGFSKIRPVASHQFRIADFVSYRGMLVFSGVNANAPEDNEHIIRSSDGKVALWAGVVDDLWKAGKPRGTGGPWKDSPVEASVPSDPYLITGYDQKKLTCSHTLDQTVNFTLQVDFTGMGDWTDFQTISVKPGQKVEYEFPEAFSAYWVRMVSDKATTATTIFDYR